MLSRNSTSFLINNMSTTYTHRKFYSAPTHFFGNTSFSKTLYKPKIFDHHQSIHSNSEMLTPVLRRIAGASIPFSILRIDKTFLIVLHTTFPYEN